MERAVFPECKGLGFCYDYWVFGFDVIWVVISGSLEFWLGSVIAVLTYWVSLS